jgi:hypothetical protein
VAKQIATALLVVSLLSCEDDKKAHDTPLAAPSTIANVLGIDAAVLGVGLIDPERPAGDLATDLATFTTVEACMKQRTSSLDPLVGDAVDAIGYDTFLRDACRVLEAAKNKEPKKCDLIDASSLRARCRTVTSMVAGDVEGCPLKSPAKPELGRDATCIAAALRSPAMCAGAQKRDRPACEALLAHDTKPCAALALDDQRVPCMRDAARFRGVLSGAPVLAKVPPPKGTLDVHGDGKPDPSQTTADLDNDVGSGVVVVLDGKRKRLSFGRFDDSFPRATQPLERMRLALSLAVSEDKPGEVIEVALTVPGAPHASCAGDGCRTITVKVTTLEPKRGGALVLSADGTLGGFRIRADVSTFVRDVVDRTTLR